jgi:hypothetical protein
VHVKSPISKTTNSDDEIIIAGHRWTWKRFQSLHSAILARQGTAEAPRAFTRLPVDRALVSVDGCVHSSEEANLSDGKLAGNKHVNREKLTLNVQEDKTN